MSSTHITYFKLPNNALELANISSRVKCSQDEINAVWNDPDGLMTDHSIDAIKMFLSMAWMENKKN